MSTRWAACRDFWNALARGEVTSSHEDPDHLTEKLYDNIPLSAARFTQTGQNDVLFDGQLCFGGAVDAIAGETLQLLSAGGSPTIFNERTREFLQAGGLTWAAGSSVLTPPVTFQVQDYARMMRSWATLTVAGTTPVVIPRLSALSIHGHEGLYQSDDAIQWHAGTASNPTGLVVDAQPEDVPQLLEASSPVLLRFHRLSFFGAQPWVGEATLTDLSSITRCTGIGRIVQRRFAQVRLDVPQGDVDAYAWALRDTVVWRGRIRGRTEHIDALKQTVYRASKGGADPMLFIPEEGLVMFGRIGEIFETRPVAEGNFDIGLSFEESPLLLAEEG